MLLHEINHKMPIYRDCALGEILMVGVTVFLMESVVFSLLTRLLLGYASLGVALTFISFVPVTKALLSQLQKMKYGKPQGHYRQWAVKKLIELKLIKSFYVARCGQWSVRRK